ncbi:MAG TPA: hypothetical protein VIZ58_01240, partial [Thermoanaerobaculia bacterium]
AEIVRAEADAAAAMARAGGGSRRDVSLRVRQAAADAERTLQTLADLWPVLLTAPRTLPGVESIPSGSASDHRTPARSPEIRGPLGVYYFDLITENLGPDAPVAALNSRRNGDVLAFEALNLADGHRSVSDIRDLLTAFYGPVPVEELTRYFDLLARARAIVWR